MHLVCSQRRLQPSGTPVRGRPGRAGGDPRRRPVRGIPLHASACLHGTTDSMSRLARGVRSGLPPGFAASRRNPAEACRLLFAGGRVASTSRAALRPNPKSSPEHCDPVLPKRDARHGRHCSEYLADPVSSISDEEDFSFSGAVFDKPESMQFVHCAWPTCGRSNIPDSTKPRWFAGNASPSWSTDLKVVGDALDAFGGSGLRRRRRASGSCCGSGEGRSCVDVVEVLVVEEKRQREPVSRVLCVGRLPGRRDGHSSRRPVTRPL